MSSGGTGLTDVEITTLDPERLRTVLTAGAVAGFEHMLTRGRELLDGRTFWNVNSTAQGGGVAEMLRSLIGYVRGGGVDARWVVIEGESEFFSITKRIHNWLHGHEGDAGELGPAQLEVYSKVTARNAEWLAERIRPDDVILLHDPQTAGMIPRLRELAVPVVWRCHVGIYPPNDRTRAAWDFLRPFVEQADGFVFSEAEYAWEGLDASRLTVIPPSIDAFSPKNHAMSFTGVAAVLHACGLTGEQGDHHSRAMFERLDGRVGRVNSEVTLIEDSRLSLADPLMLQVSRWDRLKDPAGLSLIPI